MLTHHCRELDDVLQPRRFESSLALDAAKAAAVAVSSS
jgi:hypothetical protein